MSDAAYARLAEALDRLPNGYPRTDSGVELLILMKLFTPEEAELAALLGRESESFQAIAARAGLPPAQARRRLFDLARRGLVRVVQPPGRPETGHALAFRLAPFIVGFYEAQAQSIDHELAHLIEEYLVHGGARGIMEPLPSLHRVVPAHGAVKSEWILPYDDVRALLLEAKAFSVQDCICRKQQELARGRQCSVPVHNCLSFSPDTRAARPDDISQAEAIAILDEAEQAGLVHTVSNVLAGVSYVCNCCGCCCGILLGITRYGLEHSVAAANYRASIDADRCNGCGLCVERCQVKAITEGGSAAAGSREAGTGEASGGRQQGGAAVRSAARGAVQSPALGVVVNQDRCIGCGLCVSGCALEAVSLSRKPEGEIVNPPADFAAWERERLRNRGLG